MKRLVRKILMGDTAFCRYAKICDPVRTHERVYLDTGNEIMDISQAQWIVCLEPFIFAVWIENRGQEACGRSPSKYRIYISGEAGGNRIRILKRAEAVLKLVPLDVIEDKRGTLALLRLENSRIFHLDIIRRSLIYLRYFREPGMSYSRFKAFLVAYSYPRRIRIVSFRQGDYYNIFPMDLLGEIPGCDRFVLGLQCKNHTLPRILETRQLVVSEVSCRYKDIIYGLGKHHSGHPPALEALPFRVIVSRGLGFPVPEWAESYRELHILDAIKLGSHMLMWAEVTATHQLTNRITHLSTVHFMHYLDQKSKGHPYSPA